MPSSPLRPCKQQGCPNLVKHGYCVEHQRKEVHDDYRPTSRERGYDWEWEKFSKLYKRRHPICTHCKHRVTQIVDHIIPLKDGGSKFDEDNLQGLCRPCHTIKTNKDLRGVG